MTLTLITAIIGLTSSILLVAYNKYKERKESDRQRQIPIYQEILDATHPVVDALANHKPLPAMGELTQKVATSASTKVLVAYLLFRKACIGNADNKELTESFSDMVMAIREDLGYTETSLTPELRNAIGQSILRDLQ
jgi:hypothetical protein